jgi:hypothetical protein
VEDDGGARSDETTKIDRPAAGSAMIVMARQYSFFPKQRVKRTLVNRTREY